MDNKCTANTLLTQHYSAAWLYLILYLGYMYVTFMGRNLDNRKNLTLVGFMNSVSIFDDNVVVNSIFSEDYWDEHFKMLGV